MLAIVILPICKVLKPLAIAIISSPGLTDCFTLERTCCLWGEPGIQNYHFYTGVPEESSKRVRYELEVPAAINMRFSFAPNINSNG